MKKIEMTGSPKKSFNENGKCYKTKADFLEELSSFGYEQEKIKKKNNQVDILITDDLDSTSSKMKTARDLGMEIMTYGELMDLFDLEGNM